MQTVFFLVPQQFSSENVHLRLFHWKISKYCLGAQTLSGLGGLAGIVRVRVGSLVTYYVYESSHKDRNAGVCVCIVCVCCSDIHHSACFSE